MTVKELLGHEDIKMTIHYAHLTPARKRTAVNVLDSLSTPRPNILSQTNFTITSPSTKKATVKTVTL
jgi:hypothetical protein